MNNKDPTSFPEKLGMTLGPINYLVRDYLAFLVFRLRRIQVSDVPEIPINAGATIENTEGPKPPAATSGSASSSQTPSVSKTSRVTSPIE